MSTCTLHNLQTCFRNAVVNVLGEGGLDQMNLMQLLHGAWNLQNYLENDEIRDIWKYVQEHDMHNNESEWEPIRSGLHRGG